MIVFYADLDNTLIYSYKHEIGPERIGVEVYQGRTISFMTPYTYQWLGRIREQTLFVPVTTRTREQYERINLGSRPAYALVCNGGILLEQGHEDAAWYAESRRLAEDAADALRLGEEYMTKDPHRIFEVRNVRGLFLFTKSAQPRETRRRLRERLDSSVEVFRNGEKVYVVPLHLNKGMACRRFRQRLGEETVCTLAAGDSGFDIPMLQAADRFMAPEGLCDTYGLQGGERWKEGEGIFSDFVLEQVVRRLSERAGKD